jgi:polyisoprenoid-binding protein YceI
VVPQAAVPEGARIYTLDPDATVITMLVGRAGALANFGHLHVLTSRNETGQVWAGADAAHSGFEVQIPVRDFVVDDPEARAAAGPMYAATVPDDARAGTYHNMIGTAGLDAAQYPLVVVRSEGPLDFKSTAQLRISVVLHGATRVLDIPAETSIADDVIHVTGSFDVLQSDFGMTPFHIAGGAIAVADQVEVRFDVTARVKAAH